MNFFYIHFKVRSVTGNRFLQKANKKGDTKILNFIAVDSKMLRSDWWIPCQGLLVGCRG